LVKPLQTLYRYSFEERQLKTFSIVFLCFLKVDEKRTVGVAEAIMLSAGETVKGNNGLSVITVAYYSPIATKVF
jgi:hypothetical protein